MNKVILRFNKMKYVLIVALIKFRTIKKLFKLL